MITELAQAVVDGLVRGVARRSSVAGDRDRRAAGRQPFFRAIGFPPPPLQP